MILFGNINRGLEECRAASGSILVDVREADEYASGHIPNAVNEPLSTIKQTTLPKDKPLFLYCLRGTRSKRAARILKNLGYTVKSIGGISGYKRRIESRARMCGFYSGGDSRMVDLGLKISRGDATMLYATSHGSYTVRFHLRLDQKIDGQKLRSALDKTARRYPYFCVSLKRNEREFYYEINDRPVALLHTNKAITLGSSETNGHIWAVCYDGEDLFIDYFHGRSDGTGMYALIATLLYHYFDEQAIPGIKTLDTPISEEETHDPVEDLPLLDLSKVSFPASPKALNLMKASGLEHVNGKGLILKLMIPEESFLPFMRSNDGTPGIMLSVLIARAIERVHPQHEAPLVSNYVVNARPMLKADETFHNCTNRVVFHYDDRIRRMPLKRQCTVYRGKTFIQADEETIVQGMTVAGSMAQMILDLPDFSTKAKIASQAMAGTYDATTYIVSYVGRWKYPQLGRHIREFWTETPVGPFPLIEVAAVNGRIFVSFLQPFSDRRYYDALLDELKENGIEYVECGSTTVSVAEIKD